MSKKDDSKWNISRVAFLLERANELHYYVPLAEGGLADKRRGEAAHAECRVYFKTFLLFRSLSRLIAFIVAHVKLEAYEYYSIESVLAADSGFPMYLDAFEEYVSRFGDKWFDQEENRSTYFDLLLNAFLSIVRELGELADIPIEKDRGLRFAIGFFAQEFRNVAVYEAHGMRQESVPDLLVGFRDIRKKIEPIFQAAIKAEARFVKEFSHLKPMDARGKPLLKKYSDIAKKEDEALLRPFGDKRPICKVDDERYYRIECLTSIWHRMPPSVMRFMECCRLIEESAVLASNNTMDRTYSTRSFVASLFVILAYHPKHGAKSITDLSFTEDEKGQMSVAFKNMSLALLRLRQKLKSDSGIFNLDPEEYDGFIAALSSLLGPETRDYRSLLFEEGDAKEEDGYNKMPFLTLYHNAQTRYRTFTLRRSKNLDKDKKAVEQTINKAYASGSRKVIEETYDALVKKYFKADAKKDGESDPLAGSSLATLIESSEGTYSADFPEPGHDYKQDGRFAYAPKFRTIIDMDHRGEPYFIAPYENFTATSVVEIIKTLLRAVGKKDGWVKCDRNWRMRFKDYPYKRFKDEQIQVGTKSNQHHGQWRIIPRDLFKELTKAPKCDNASVGRVGTVSKCGKSSHG